MDDASDLRLSDADREGAIRSLREHFAAGRLTEQEFGDRVQAAYKARNMADLRGLLADLPLLPASRAEQHVELAQRRGTLQRRLIQQSGGGLAAFVICTVIWLADGASGMFWPIWVALVVLIPLLVNGWRLYGPAPELDRVEQELARRERDRGARHEHRGRGRRRDR